MSSSTLYAKVEETIATEIARGEYRPGDQLPTEDELLERFQVSRITVRRAIQNLVHRRLLEIRRGLGTFVLAPRIEAELTKLTGFVEDMNAVGRKATARVVGQRVVSASARVAERLHLTKGTKVMQIERVRLADEVPISFDETFLPLPLGKQIVHNDLRFHPIFALLEEEYGVPLVEADYELEAVIATKAIADALQVRVGSPIFQVERTSKTIGDRPVDYEVLSYRGDLVRFVTKLSRHTAKSTGSQTLRSRKR
ncbi:GntR family transcriptional regulator [Alloacidobacterium dinghuense]|uniref:GntR family transcriptional regulator n=1 Tax=Alloacidobacterium dinghuense TaxID=2763107 RepID=A0A7G8BCW3_9BACT|nr:GntR family transcriptional regulator [Alloacidobacterium dinghuense]QNI30383.1 GntR family transcriptional regulator [Alloacidobacterium dinghuense]